MCILTAEAGPGEPLLSCFSFATIKKFSSLSIKCQIFVFCVFSIETYTAAAAAAASLQSYLTLCDPIDGIPPGSPMSGICSRQGTYTLPHIKKTASGSWMCDARPSQPVLWDNLERWSGLGAERGVQELGDTCVLGLTHADVWENPPQYCKAI